jgi:CPA2 family monovalent cation:H+ antiporter-2
MSAALGAFAVGLLISQSHYSHQVLGDIAPLRDIFCALFFVSVGGLIDLDYIGGHVSAITMVVLVIVAGKFFVCSATARAFGYKGKSVPLIGAGMIQVGEFSFVLAELGLSTEVLSQDSYSLILASAMVSIALTPFLYGVATRLTTRTIDAGWLKPLLSCSTN